MRKLVILAVAIALSSCNNETPEVTVFSGTISNTNAKNVTLSGSEFTAEMPLDETGKFADTLDIKANGFYTFSAGRESTELYLEKGRSLDISLDTEEFDESIIYTGDLAAENNYLAQKYLYDEVNVNFQKLFAKGEGAFKEAMTRSKNSYDSLMTANKISNTAFKTLEDDKNTYKEAENILIYENYHRFLTKKQEFTVSKDFYAPLENINYKDTTAYRNSAAYRSLVGTYMNTEAADAFNADSTSTKNYSITYLKMVDTKLPDGYAKDDIMTSYLEFGLKPDESLEEQFQLYKSTNPSSENLEKVTARFETLKNLVPGNASPTFAYENYKGGETTLADLNGKYVYVDVWATWCGPCIAEIPSLKKVEADYEDMPVQFVSISIDVDGDKEKWKTMIAEKELGGIQLFADNNWKSDFVQGYGIKGIPRFILIGPEGKIVSADAPRPSNPELRKLLDSKMKS